MSVKELEVQDQEQELEYFKFRDNHGKEYILPKVIKSEEGDIPLDVLFGHAISKSRSEAKKKTEEKYSSVINELNEIKGEYENTRSKLAELETQGLNPKDLEYKDLKRKLDQYEKEKKTFEEKSVQNYDKYKNERIKSEIFSAFSGYELHNLDQTAKLFQADTQTIFEEDEEGSKVKIRITLPNESGDLQDLEGSPKEIFGKWIGMQSNSYLLKNTLSSGGGTSKTGATRTSNGQLTYKRSQLTNPLVRKEYNDKLKEGLDVSIVDG